MKKLYSFFFAIMVTIAANAQLTTKSNYDVNADGKVTVDDATAVVSNYVGDNNGERQMVDAEQLNATLQSIFTELKSLGNRLSAIESKLDISNGESEDPYNERIKTLAKIMKE